MTEFDSPWKEALDQFFGTFLAFFFPAIHADADWSSDHEALDAELHQLAPAGEGGKRLADRLVKLKLRSGQSVILHVEVQAQPDDDLPFRVLTYHYRVLDRYHEPVVSLVILGDESPTWRPDAYVFSRWGCDFTLRFPVVKLLDWRNRLEELESSPNPFGLLVWAHLQAQRTQHDPDARQACKLHILHNLYERQLDKEDVRQWYRLFDWLLRLPPERERQVWEVFHRLREEKIVPHVTYAEIYGREKGLEQGLEKGLEKGRREGLVEAITMGLELKFGAPGLALLPLLQPAKTVVGLQQIVAAIRAGKSLEEIAAQMQALPAAPEEKEV